MRRLFKQLPSADEPLEQLENLKSMWGLSDQRPAIERPSNVSSDIYQTQANGRSVPRRPRRSSRS